MSVIALFLKNWRQARSGQFRYLRRSRMRRIETLNASRISYCRPARAARQIVSIMRWCSIGNAALQNGIIAYFSII
jgi:hypothetical protein